jgi:hypothetical protein
MRLGVLTPQPVYGPVIGFLWVMYILVILCVRYLAMRIAVATVQLNYEHEIKNQDASY